MPGVHLQLTPITPDFFSALGVHRWLRLCGPQRKSWNWETIFTDNIGLHRVQKKMVYFVCTVNQLLINLVPITRDALLEMPGVRLKFPVSSILASNFCNPLNVHFFSGESNYTMCS